MAGDDLFTKFGGLDSCRRLSREFYARVAQDPILRPIFPSSFHCAVEALALFLAQFLGGPCEYSRQRWWLSLREAHQRFPIGRRERDAWMDNMRQALAGMQADQSVGEILLGVFEHSSAQLVNRGEVAAPRSSIHSSMANQWNGHVALEDAVAAVRAGDLPRTVTLTESPVLRDTFERDPAALISLLALMIAARGAFADYVLGRVKTDPSLAHATFSRGRTLLHAAAVAANLDTARFLLELGADPNAADEAGHRPLYCLANECTLPGARDMVSLLVKAGAEIDAHDKAKRCTALHMAARRGNVEVAEALLDCGAALEVRDIKSETPLRRAVNCSKPKLTALLLQRGANRHAKDKTGLTPEQAARTAAMKSLFTT